MPRLLLLPLVVIAALVTAAPAQDEPGAKVSGPVGPDGTEISCDLPGELHSKNIAARGLGCCVFRSIDHAARWADVPALQKFPEWMVSKGLEGGGWPERVAKLIPQIAADRKMPVPHFVQVEGKDLEILRLASKTGRMICCTYSQSPTGRYGGQRIAHMVNAVLCDDRHVVILDNNYPGSDQYEWLTPEEFLRTYTGGGQGWSVILLAPPPPAPPRGPKK